ncbi:MAG: transporter permease subunit [Paenibacillus sp.]|jgi:putative aldouronate transport system permease protein|nr:transporter permease subunit [Paenibacillus sp.]
MKATIGETVFYICNYVVLSIIALSCLFPLLHLIALSLSDAHSVTSGFVTIWPRGWTIVSYIGLLQGTNVINAFKNSVVITMIGVGLSMIFTILAAYPLSRNYFYARRTFTLFTVFTMMFSGGLIPSYLIVKSLGLVNTYFALWLPALVGTYNMLVMKTYFENIPGELEEAGRVDGCGEIRLLWNVILPVSMPMIATLSLFYGVSFWNAFMNVLIYINDTDKFNLSVLIQQMVRSQSILTELEVNSLAQDEEIQMTPESIKAAGIMIMVIPMLLVYPLLQKHFVKGVLIGSIKG